jgi:hypothetical protein
MEKKTPKEYRVGQHVRVKLSGGRIEEAKIAAVIPNDDGVQTLGSSQRKGWQLTPIRLCTATLPSFCFATRIYFWLKRYRSA